MDADNNQPVTINLDQSKYNKIEGEIITGKKVNSYNDFDKPEEVTLSIFNDFELVNQNIEVTMPSKSVVHLKVSK